MPVRMYQFFLKVPRYIWRKIEHRLAYAVFQTTRVTNDHYGWKPQDEHEVKDE